MPQPPDIHLYLESPLSIDLAFRSGAVRMTSPLGSPAVTVNPDPQGHGSSPIFHPDTLTNTECTTSGPISNLPAEIAAERIMREMKDAVKQAVVDSATYDH
jgi:hypothetical protein